MDSITRNSRPQISVIGSGHAPKRLTRKAYRVGRLLGRHDVTLVCGGGGGVMQAACRGVAECETGISVGVLKETVGSLGNPHLDVRIPTGIGEARNLAVVLSGDAVVAVGGGMGTLTEIAFAIKHDRSVFGVDTWEHERFAFPTDLTPDEAVERALEAARDSGSG